MKRKALIIAALTLAVSSPVTVIAAEHDHGSMHSGHGSQMAQMGKVVHQQVVDGVKVTFRLIDMKEQMKGMEIPKGMKETHHLMANFADAKTGKPLTEGEVKAKVAGPDKSEQTKALMGMEGHFGADFIMANKGRYGVMCKFKVKDGKIRSSKFWYVMK